MSPRHRLFWTAPLVAALAGACTNAPTFAPRAPGRANTRETARARSGLPPASFTAGKSEATEKTCARRHPGAGATRASTNRQSSAIAVVRLDERTLVYAADADRRAIHTVDIDARALVGTTSLDGAPSGLLVMDDGRVAVALRDRNRVVILEPDADPAAPLAPLCSAAVPSEPFALASDTGEATLFVTSGWGHALTALDTGSLDARYSVRLPREPRAVLVDPSGKRAFVSHAVGDALSVVDLEDESHPARGVDVRVGTGENGKPRRAGQGFALVGLYQTNPDGGERLTRVLAPSVTVDQAAGSVSSETYGSRFLSAAPLVAVVDAAREDLLTRQLHLSGDLEDLGGPGAACTLPRAAAAASGDRLLVGCLGVDAVLELDARARDPMQFERRRFRVPAGPVGIAIDAAHERAVVWSEFAAAVSVLDLRDENAAKPAAEIAVGAGLPSGLGAVEARGRILFHATNDARISGDGRACASCHVDGRDDGITWTTPEGPHQTIMLAGRAGESAPFGWRGDTRTLVHHVGRTMKRLAGRGVFSKEDRADLEALVAYLKVMPAPKNAEMDESRQKLVARGREVFDDPRQGCATCHPSGGSDGAAWDVAKSPFHIAIDTPSLRFVGGTAPYFHDGRHATLGELLRKVDGSMGHTGSLSNEDLGALEAYLEEL
jgi:mono/diheme cytochrome c family protein